MSIFHIAELPDWEDARDAGAYRISTRGATLDDVGFIHASKDRGQVERVAAAVYADLEQDLVVLELNEEAIEESGTPVKYEDGGAGDGELFPHIYGPIDPTWVAVVLPGGFVDGKFVY